MNDEAIAKVLRAMVSVIFISELVLQYVTFTGVPHCIRVETLYLVHYLHRTVKLILAEHFMVSPLLTKSVFEVGSIVNDEILRDKYELVRSLWDAHYYRRFPHWYTCSPDRPDKHGLHLLADHSRIEFNAHGDALLSYSGLYLIRVWSARNAILGTRNGARVRKDVHIICRHLGIRMHSNSSSNTAYTLSTANNTLHIAFEDVAFSTKAWPGATAIKHPQ